MDRGSLKTILPARSGWSRRRGRAGPADSLARFIGAKLSERLHQSVVIQNRPGARTMIGNEMVSHAPPDGYTLLWGASDMTMLPLLLKSAANFDPSRNLTPIALAVSTWGAYAINPKLPAKNLTEFVAYAKANPGKLHYGTNGPAARFTWRSNSWK